MLNIKTMLLCGYIIIISLALILLSCGNSEQKHNNQGMGYFHLDPDLEKISFDLANMKSDISELKDSACLMVQLDSPDKKNPMSYPLGSPQRTALDTEKQKSNQTRLGILARIWNWLFTGAQQPNPDNFAPTPPPAPLDRKLELEFNQMSIDETAQDKAYCDVYTILQIETDKVFDKIKESNKIPDKLYNFSVFDMDLTNSDSGDDQEETYKEYNVGVFYDIDTCNKFALLAMNKNIPIRKCRLWKPEPWN